MSNTFTRIAGIVGILNVVLMVGIFLTMGPEGTPGQSAKALLLSSQYCPAGDNTYRHRVKKNNLREL